MKNLKAIILLTSLLLSQATQSESISKFNWNKNILHKFAHSLIENQNYLSENNLKASIQVKFGNISKNYNQKSLRCLAKSHCLSSLPIPISAKITSIQIFSKSWLNFNTKPNPWIQELGQHFNLPIRIKSAKTPWSLIFFLLFLGFTLMTFGIAVFRYNLKKPRIKPPSAPLLPPDIKPNHQEIYKDEMQNELSQKITLDSIFSDIPLSVDEKTEISKLINENAILATELDGLKFLWHSAINENHVLKNKHGISEKLPQDLASKILKDLQPKKAIDPPDTKEELDLY